MVKIDDSPLKFLALAILSGSLTVFAADEDAPGPARHRLQVTASVPPLDVEPGSGERRPLSLPSLDVTFRMRADCRESFSAEQLSLTIADSRRFLDSAELSAAGLDDVHLTVPANQLAPLILTDFCRRDPDAEIRTAVFEPETTLTLAAILSANAALLCQSGDSEEMIYAATPLDLTLVCKEGDAAERTGGE